MHVRWRQAERSNSIVPPDMNPFLSKKSFLPLSFKQDLSTTTMENSTNKTKYSQWDSSLIILPDLYIKFWNSSTISVLFPWVFCHFMHVCIIRQFLGSKRWENQCEFASPWYHPKLTLFLLEAVPIWCERCRFNSHLHQMLPRWQEGFFSLLWKKKYSISLPHWEFKRIEPKWCFSSSNSKLVETSH